MPTENTQQPDYDPFADYIEFDQSNEIKKDIQFFQQGRFLSLEGMLGGRLFTGEMRNFVIPSVNFGVSGSIFLNLEFAVQAYVLTSAHPASLVNDNDTWLQYLTFGLDIKYYFDKNQLVREIGFFNPYLFAGFSFNTKYTRTPASCSDLPALLDPVRGIGGRFGSGIEVNFSKRFYIGVQGDYTFVTFPDESVSITVCEHKTQKKLAGDLINLLFKIGINF